MSDESKKSMGWLGRLGTFIVGILIMSFAKAACHHNTPVKQMTQEELKVEALRLYQNGAAKQRESKASEKPKYPRALYGGGVSWDEQKK